jgi:UDP-glucose 4-epimerase
VAGGAGYIGAPFCKMAAAAGFAPVVVDRLSSPSPRVEAYRRSAVQWGPLEVADIGDSDAISAIIQKHKPVAAVCFAALIEVAESIAKPELYWENNFEKAGRFFNTLTKGGVSKLVFSSTAAVYGEAHKPLKEDSKLAPINPYGMTKLGCETMLHGTGRDKAEIQKRNPLAFPFMKSVVFRYFNAAGALPEVGEMHEPETHLIPNAIFAAQRQRGFGTEKQFTLYGTDYPTRDGTCIRDFVHVEDLATAHVLGVQYLLEGGTSDVFNLGTGTGMSVREVVAAVRTATGSDFEVREVPRRAGDPPLLVADASKAASALGWKPRHDLNSIVASAVAFHRQQG